jgi:hypothetical protein
MEEFKLAVRQFAIKEFHLGVEKSCTQRHRAYCKSSDESTGPCPWRINGRKLDGSATVEVNNFLYYFMGFLYLIHTCVIH